MPETMDVVRAGWAAYGGTALKVTAVLLTALIVDRAARRASAATRHLLWAAALFAALLVPVLEGALPAWPVAVLPAEGTLVASARTTAPEISAPAPPAAAKRAAPTASTVDSPARAATPPASAGWSASRVVFVVWASGAAVTVLPFLVGMLAGARICRRARLGEGRIGDAFRDQAQALGLSRAPRLLVSADISMPTTFGMLRPVVLLPEDAAEWPESRREAVLAHELAHVQRRDCLVQGFAHLALAVYWPHPLAWLAVRRLRVEREKACDDLVVAQGTPGSEYAEHLLDVARDLRPGTELLAAVAMARPSQLEGRLLAILDAHRDRRMATRAAVCAAAVLAIALAVPVAAVRPVAAAPSLSEEEPALVAALPATLTPMAPVLVAQAQPQAAPRPAPSARTLATDASDAASEPDDDVDPDPNPNPNPNPRAYGTWDKVAIAEAVRHGLWGNVRGPRKDVDPAIAQAVIAALSDTDAEVRAQAAHSLGELRPAAAAPALAIALRDTSPDVRSAAAHALGNLAAREAVDALAQLVDDKDGDVRQSALWALGQIRDPRTAPPLMKALSDADPDVRQSAAHALGELRHKPAVSALVPVLKDAHPDVRQTAAHALGEIGSNEAVTALMAAVADAHSDVRSAAVRALAEIGDPRGLDAVTRALKDKDAEVRRDALHALTQLAGRTPEQPEQP